MSRSGFRHSSVDLAYGDEPPNRWDRERFESIRRRPAAEEPRERETIRITERDGPRRQEVRVEDRIDLDRRARGRYDEADFSMFEQERYGPPARIIRPRRSDRDLYEEVRRREAEERALAGRTQFVERERDREVEIRREASRPGLLRRQSSLDTFDRRPLRYSEREDYRMPPDVEIPLPPSRRRPVYREEDFEDIRYRDYSPHDYRDVEIMRERSVERRRRRRARSQVRSSRSDSSDDFEHISRHSSPSPERKVGKKGRTRMPKRLVRKEAIMQLGYPFEEEDDFIIVRRALEKEQIDEVIKISDSLKGPKTTKYRFDERITEGAAPMQQASDEHYEALRTEWINPPSVRAPSPTRSSRSRAPTVRAASPPQVPIVVSPPPQQIRETIYVQAPAPPPPPPQPQQTRETIYVQAPAPPPAPPQPQQPMTIVLPERHRREERDYKYEIERLEAEARAVRLEREGRGELIRYRDRPEEDYQLVEFRERRPERVVEYVERERSPKREVIRVEKDRKGRMALVRSSK